MTEDGLGGGQKGLWDDAERCRRGNMVTLVSVKGGNENWTKSQSGVDTV